MKLTAPPPHPPKIAGLVTELERIVIIGVKQGWRICRFIRMSFYILGSNLIEVVFAFNPSGVDKINYRSSTGVDLIDYPHSVNVCPCIYVRDPNRKLFWNMFGNNS
ncbi:Hypothetical predicted protein [Octopus vulgaris]|uniref:Uncharacterized protein n=1 Tax=Octopus vulgaris TaxID=6645 RepID=A0AA36BKQ7_OCTVU|nr:Hypothetical predicted protein [Octopus vulgaris]